MDVLNPRPPWLYMTLRLLASLLLVTVPATWILKNSYPLLPEPLVFNADLQQGKTGLVGPLVITGRPLAGDFLFVEWIQPGQVIFCYNSWGSSETLKSKPVEFQPGQILRLKVTMPSLAQPEQSGNPGWGTLQVECNGIGLLEASPRSYPASSWQLAFGKNLFGNTLCGKKLPGKLFLENGHPLQGDPGAFFTPYQRLHTWLTDCWWKILPLLGVALIFFRITRSMPFLLQTRHPIDESMRRFSRFIFCLNAPWFWAGLVLTLTLLSLSGRQLSHQAYIENFQRFYAQLCTESYFYPSSSLLKSLAESKSESGKILVIVGGSSVANGVGQPAKELWTNILQKDLGPSYEVINFAVKGGHPRGFGAVAAEMLRKEGRKVLYVADMFPGQSIDPDGQTTYRYVYWDAFYKGLLQKDLPREEYLKNRIPEKGDREPLNETKLSMWFNSLFYSLDFWNSLGYTSFFTVWNSYMNPFYEARKKSVDPEPEPLPVEKRYIVNADADMKLVQRAVDSFYPGQPGDSVVLSPAVLAGFEYQPPWNFTKEVRHEMILFTAGYSPFYREKLSAIDQERMVRIYATQKEVIEKQGIRFINATGYLDREDYVDRCHLSPSGGKKLAALVATAIKEISLPPESIVHEK